MKLRNKIGAVSLVLLFCFQAQGVHPIIQGLKYGAKRAFKSWPVRGVAAALIHDISLRKLDKERKLGLPSRMLVYGICGLSIGNFTDRRRLFSAIKGLEKDHYIMKGMLDRNYKKQCKTHKEVKDITRGVGQLGKGQDEIKDLLANKPDKSWFGRFKLSNYISALSENDFDKTAVKFYENHNEYIDEDLEDI